MSRTLLSLTLLAALALTACSRAAPPKPDLTDLPAYMAALNKSQDPEAAAIRKEIADGPAALARERAAAQAAGIPLEAAQLQRPLPAPDQNAAPLYQQLDALRHAKPLNLPKYAQPLGGTYAYTPAQLAAVQAIFDGRRDVFDLLHQAAGRPQCVFPKNWSLGPALLFPELAGLREDARELDTEGSLLARQGHYSEAITTQALGFHFAGHAASDPALLNFLVGVAADAITLGGLRNILTLAGPDAAVDAQVRQAVATGRPPLSLRHALTGEVAIGLVTLESLRTHPAQFSQAFVPAAAKPPLLPPDQAQFAGDLVAAVEARYLSRMRRLIAVADQAGPARSDLFKSLSRPSGDGVTPGRSLDALKKLEDTLTFSDFTKVVDKDDQIHALEQVTMAAAAVLAAKARTGAFPDALPGGFPDPFTGKALGYRREGAGGFVVYSVGPDGKFNGGGPGEYVFTPTQALFRYPGPPLKPVPPEML